MFVFKLSGIQKQLLSFLCHVEELTFLIKKKDRENTDDRMLIQALQGKHLYKLENKGSLGIEPRRNCTHFFKKLDSWSPGADFIPFIFTKGIN